MSPIAIYRQRRQSYLTSPNLSRDFIKSKRSRQKVNSLNLRVEQIIEIYLAVDALNTRLQNSVRIKRKMNFEPKYPLCVEWTTELPSVIISQNTSPNIFLEGFEMKLRLSYKAEQCILSMFVQNKEPKLRKIITFSTCIYAQQTSIYERKLIDSQTYSNFFLGKDIIRGCWATFWTKSRKALDEIYTFYPARRLTVICVFHSLDTHLLKKIHVSTQTTLKSVTADLQILSRDFSTFLKDETFSDVKLKCADRTFSAHRFVLAARSEVFAGMFRNQMAEAVNCMVRIKDVDPDVLELLLEYMYSAEWPDLCEETAHRLYEAADKYAVHGLRRVCSDWMVERQTTDNCLDLLVLADKHSDKTFQKAVVCFVAKHLSDLCIESWSTFREKFPLLVLPVLEKRCEDSMPGAAKGS